MEYRPENKTSSSYLWLLKLIKAAMPIAMLVDQPLPLIPNEAELLIEDIR
jgi:hypothetical protein